MILLGFFHVRTSLDMFFCSFTQRNIHNSFSAKANEWYFNSSEINMNVTFMFVLSPFLLFDSNDCVVNKLARERERNDDTIFREHTAFHANIKMKWMGKNKTRKKASKVRIKTCQIIVLLQHICWGFASAHATMCVCTLYTVGLSHQESPHKIDD